MSVISQSVVSDIPVDEVRCPLIDRVRCPEAVARMADSLQRVGQLNPVVVTRRRDGAGYAAVCGWTRREAAMLLHWPTLKAVVLDGEDAARLTSHAVIDNTARTNLSLFDAWQQATLLIRATGETQAEVAKMMGCSPSTISRLLRLGTLEPYIQDALKTDALTFDDAYSLACIDEPVRRLELFEQVKSGARQRGSLTVSVGRSSKSSRKPITIRLAGQSFRWAGGTNPVKALKSVANQIESALKTFKASGQAAETFPDWLLNHLRAADGVDSASR